MAHQSILPRELRFAWLLRDDIRQQRHMEDQEAQKDFEVWWALHARKEYPDAAGRVPAAALAHLADVVAPAMPGDPFPLTRLMAGVWRQRTDVAAIYHPDAPAGMSGFIRWFFVHGVGEHDLFELLPPEHRTLLLALVLAPQGPWDAPLNLLQLYTWQADAAVRSAFPLERPAHRARFAGWYYCEALNTLKHRRYYDPATLRWLAEPHPAVPGLCRLAVQAWGWANQSDDAECLCVPAVRQTAQDWFAGVAVPRFGLNALLVPEDGRTSSTAVVNPKPEASFVPGANVVGFARGELGIGEDSRMAAAALEACGVPCAVFNVSTGPDTRQQDASLESRLSAHAPYALNMFCLTGLDTARLWLERGPTLFGGRINVGCWPWELPEWPAVWRDAYALVDEVWASSLYTREAFLKSSPVPVRLMPMAVSVDRLRRSPRSAFGLPDEAFLFLYVFDFNSYLARKNPWAALRAFRRAFPTGHEPVRLVLKVMNSRNGDARWDAFAHEAAQDARVLHIGGTLDRCDVLGLFAACDAYVSPHRAEGFGRTLAEAMLLGKPVVATGYSGSADFLTEDTGFPVGGRLVPVGAGEYPYGEGLWWAEPDQDHLARRMREVWEHPERARAVAENGRSLILRRHSPAAVGAAYRSRIEALLEERTSGRVRPGNTRAAWSA